MEAMMRAEHRRSGFESVFPQMNTQRAITAIKHRSAVQKTIGLIGAQTQDPPTLAELACSAGLSRTYFSQVFKEVVGMGFKDYLAQVRMDKAKDLLKDITLTVKEVACMAGFRDPNYFSRTFKKKTGLSPTDWRLGEITIC